MIKYINWKIFGVFLAMILVVWGGYKIWDSYFSETAKLRQAAEDYKKAEQAYIEAMTADTYGGKTPQETLDLFVAALRKGDIELASKYFLLDENLSREKWVAKLTDIKNRSHLNRFADDISKKAVAGDIKTADEFGYVLYNADGTVGLQINMRLNQFSGPWKIESL